MKETKDFVVNLSGTDISKQLIYIYIYILIHILDYSNIYIYTNSIISYMIKKHILRHYMLLI